MITDRINNMVKTELVASRLKQATQLLEQVLEQLDIAKDACPTCGLEKCRNWEDAQNAKILKSAIRKLQLVKDHLK